MYRRKVMLDLVFWKQIGFYIHNIFSKKLTVAENNITILKKADFFVKDIYFQKFAICTLHIDKFRIIVNKLKTTELFNKHERVEEGYASF